MLEFSVMENLLRRVLSRAADYADFYVEDTARSGLRIDDQRVDIVSGGRDRGAGLRVVAGDTTIYAHTSDLSESALVNLAEETVAALSSAAPGITTFEVVASKEAGREVARPPSTVSPREKVELLWRADKAARARSSKIKQVTVSYADSVKSFKLVNSLGQRVSESRTYTRLMIQTVAMDAGVMQTGFEAPGKQSGFEFFNQVSPESAAEIAADKALRMLEAKAAPTGPMPVVLGPGSGGVIFHEAVGHGLEGDHIEKGSVYSGRRGSKVASDVVTLIDDSTLEGLWGSYNFDDEGEVSRRRVLIENGILQGFLCDRYWGDRLEVGSSGSGRRESYAYSPIARMSNTYLQPGEATAEEIIGSTKRGIYAKKLGGGQVDPQTGDFVFGVSEGYLIENGKLGSPVRGATLIGNGPDILMKIDMVGNDLDFDPGTCGKDGQGIPVCIGQPTCRVTEMTVGGTTFGGGQ